MYRSCRPLSVLLAAAVAGGCAGQIDGDSNEVDGTPRSGVGGAGTIPGRPGEPVGGASAGGGAAGVPLPPPGMAGADTFRFDCDPSAPAPRLLRRLSRTELLQHLINVFSGTAFSASKLDVLIGNLPEDNGDETHYVEEDLDTTEGHVQALLNLAESLATTASGLTATELDLLSGGQCKAIGAAGMDACVKGIGDELGLRLYRRPLVDGELVKLKAYLGGVGATTTAQALGGAMAYLFLQPPSLLHLEDAGSPLPARQALQLTPFEAMNRVHFALLGAPPPISLLKKIRMPTWTRVQAEQRIDEILASSAFRARAMSFFESWLGVGRNVDLSALPAAMTRGLLPKELSGEAYEELKTFLMATVFEPRSGGAELYGSTKVHHIGPSLAKVYGLDTTAKGPLNPPLQLDPTKHAGLLGRAAMNLYVESQTSPISRGVRVKRKLLCEDIHPPANVNLDGPGAIEIDDPDKYSNRFLTENKTRAPLCRACHVSIDGIGFALDFYDSVGRFRTEEIRYDPKGNMVRTFPLSTDVPVQVMPGRTVAAGGPVGLSKEIAATETGSACLVSQWLAFSSQIDKYATRSCLKRTLHEKVISGGAGTLDMMRTAARAELDAVKFLGRQP